MPKKKTTLIRSTDFKTIYAVGAIGTWTPYDFRINFYNEKVIEDNEEVFVNDTQVVLSPKATKEFALWLLQNIKDYEATYGKSIPTGSAAKIGSEESEFRSELRTELKDDIKGDLKDIVQSDLKDSLKKELGVEIKNDLRKYVKQSLPKDLKKDLKVIPTPELKKDLKKDLKADLKQDLRKDIKKGVEIELKRTLPAGTVSATSKLRSKSGTHKASAVKPPRSGNARTSPAKSTKHRKRKK
jgi:hypothetical protein